MINHYNAFISYKHAPEDNKVAEAVHKGLERFHIPSKIRKKMGVKKIERIFRDKDELPITNDLSDTIASALENSDYLIVICSTNTKESAWVPREIEYFLKNHTKRDIFTVLVNGEPYDVIPDVLKYDERVVIDENGNEQTVNIPIEPLSCDFRMPFGKAKKTELPRLVCGIVGCAYDELMNRHRQYRLKQITAVFSIAFALMIGFSGYMYYSRNQIHKNYLESLKNQSKYLANESLSLLEKEERITALLLALEALPKNDSDDRPITAEAVKALTDATLAYEGDDGNNINAAWNYQMPNIISDFKISSDKKTIAIVDEGNVVGVWDTQTHDRKMYFDDIDNTVIGIAFLSDSNFALWNEDTISCYDVASGEKLWDYKAEEQYFDDGNNLMIMDDFLFIATSKRNYLKLDCTSGKLIKEVLFPEKEGYEDLGIAESKISPDGKKIAFRGLNGWNSYAYGILDIDSGKVSISDVVEETVKDIEWVGNDTLMISSGVVDMSGSMSFGSKDIISSDHSMIRCINAADLSEKWNSEFVCNGVMINSGFVTLGNTVAFYSGNVISVYNLADGSLKYSNNVNDSIVDVSDIDGDGNPVYITENGGYATPALSVDTDAVYYTKYFADELRQVAIGDGVYVRKNLSHEVLFYGVHVYDEEWKRLGEDTLLADVSDEFFIDDKTLAIVSGGDNGSYLTTFGLDDGAKAVSNRLEGDAYKYKMLGIYNDHVYLGYNNEGSYNLVLVDVKGEDVQNEDFFKMSASFDDSCMMKAGKLIYTYANDSYENFVAVYDIDTKEKNDIKLPEDIGYIKHVPVYYEDGVTFVSGEKLYVFDTDSGKAKEVKTPENFAQASCFADNSAQGLYAVSDGKRIIFVTANGKVSTTIGCPGVSLIGMTFLDDALLVVYNDGSLYWYAKDSGQFTKKADISAYYSFDGKVSFDYDEENQLLYIQMDELTDVIDMESGVEIAHIANSFGHHKRKDIFITSAGGSEEEVKVGYYKRYSVEELIEKAHKIINNAKLSEETKSYYGIE